MNRRVLLAALMASLAAAGTAAADGFTDTIVRQLRAQGYSDVSVSDTWLGRTRIFAQSGNSEREIVLNPRTGEILRDIYIGDGSGSRIYDDEDNSGRGQSGGDDDDDDDGDDDNSGHGGGGNSGGGGGNSGGGGGDDD
jgi:uncharacterized membrane protein YgcG